MLGIAKYLAHFYLPWTSFNFTAKFSQTFSFSWSFAFKEAISPWALLFSSSWLLEVVDNISNRSFSWEFFLIKAQYTNKYKKIWLKKFAEHFDVKVMNRLEKMQKKCFFQAWNLVNFFFKK